MTETEVGPYGFVEGCTRVHKTGGAALKRSKQMPLVAPIFGITSRSWALAWFDSLVQLEFPFDQRPVGAVCRAPLSGKLGKRALASDEISDFANECLGLEGTTQISSHCFKSTTLTWSSKYGLDEAARTLPGHHELPSQSLACYSRDMLSRPLALYQGMLKNIRDGHFRPDESRSGRMVHGAQHDSESKPADDFFPSPSPPASEKS